MFSEGDWSKNNDIVAHVVNSERVHVGQDKRCCFGLFLVLSQLGLPSLPGSATLKSVPALYRNHKTWLRQNPATGEPN